MLEYFSPSNVGKIYGCEPVHSLHPALQSSAEAVGLGGKLEVLGCGAQERSLIPELSRQGLLSLKKKGESEGVFDTIVAVRSLCSVPELEGTLEMLYGLLKPGGKFLVWEHTVVKPYLSGAEQKEAEKRSKSSPPLSSFPCPPTPLSLLPSSLSTCPPLPFPLHSLPSLPLLSAFSPLSQLN